MVGYEGCKWDGPCRVGIWRWDILFVSDVWLLFWLCALKHKSGDTKLISLALIASIISDKYTERERESWWGCTRCTQQGQKGADLVLRLYIYNIWKVIGYLSFHAMSWTHREKSRCKAIYVLCYSHDERGVNFAATPRGRVWCPEWIIMEILFIFYIFCCLLKMVTQYKNYDYFNV